MQKKLITLISILFLLALTACAPKPEVKTLDPAQALAAKDLIAHWPFEDLNRQTVSIETRRRTVERELITTTEAVTSYKETIYGHSKQQQGVSGQALKFDQYSSEIIRKSTETPNINPESFTIEAWIAPQSYPWNWCPIVMQRDENSGYYFGVDGDGRFGMHVSIDGKWYECNSKMPFPGLKTEHQWNSDARAWEYKGEGKAPPQPEPFGENRGKPVVKLLKWSHIVGTFDSERGIKIYLNGMLEGKLAFAGQMTPAEDAEMRIGRDTKKMRPTHTERPRFTFPINYSFDGLIDEVKIYNSALSAQEVMEAFLQTQPQVAQPLEFRKIPTGPKGPKSFGAYYTKLDYDEDYDREWRIAEHQDVIVMFDEYPFKLVYWHGINGYPVWYSENDIGLMHEDTETWRHLGCQEALMDKECRFSRVRIIENNDARVVIHWRHAMNNINYELIHEDPLTGWGDWCDEYLTIYPDGVAARKLIHWCSELDKGHSYEQDNFIIPIGMTPADILEKEAITLANLDGEESKLSWAETGWPTGKEIEDAVVLKYNIKAEAKPFMIVHPEMAEVALEGNSRPWPHCFYWWNHWPVAMIPSDGKQIYMVDGRPSSTCITGNTYSTDHPLNERTENSIKQYLLLGMTMDKSAGELAALARS
ncbi:MAG: LamG domain-containing protein, partial [Planctomycetota bacterium]